MTPTEIKEAQRNLKLRLRELDSMVDGALSTPAEAVRALTHRQAREYLTVVRAAIEDMENLRGYILSNVRDAQTSGPEAAR